MAREMYSRKNKLEGNGGYIESNNIRYRIGRWTLNTEVAILNAKSGPVEGIEKSSGAFNDIDGNVPTNIMPGQAVFELEGNNEGERYRFNALIISFGEFEVSGEITKSN